jgi:hypothetical protein
MNEPVESEEDVRAMGQTIANENTPLPGMKSTDTSDVNLNRDQILNEIENPSLIDGGNRTMDLTPGKEMEIEIKPTQEIETVPGQGAMEVKTDLLKEKMTGPTIISQQIVDAKPEIKLPEIEKKRPYGGVDPYKEEIK